MKRFPRLFLIRDSLAILGVLAYLCATGAQWMLNRTLDPALAPPGFESTRLLVTILLGFMGAAGVDRAVRFQPVFSKGYAHWLFTTPWSAGQPLPLGPIHLVWQDALLLVIACAVERFHLHLAGDLSLIVFGLAYLLTSTVALVMMQTRIAPRLLAIGFPALLLLVDHPVPLLALLVVEYVIVMVGFRLSLRHFPWKLLDPPRPSSAGWPFEALGPVDPAPRMPARSGIFYSALFSWWMFCVVTCLFNHVTDFQLPENANTLVGFAMMFGLVVMLLRFAAYVPCLAGSTSFFGRIASGCLFIPSYDRIFLGPLAILAGSAVAMGLLAGVAVTPLTCAAAAFLIVAPALLVGPPLNIQRLTGGHRLMPSRRTQVARSRQSPEIKIDLQQFKAF